MTTAYRIHLCGPSLMTTGVCEGSEVTRFSVSVIGSGRGIVTISPNKAMVDSGTEITFTAVPDENNEFLNWSGSTNGSQNPLTITVNENVNLTAVFTSNGPDVGEELVTNGDFSNGITGWTFGAWEGAAGTSAVENGELVIAMTAAGTEGWNAQLNTIGLDISKGKSYLVSFKARASVPFELPGNIGLNEDPWTTYSGYKKFSVGTEMDSFSFEFTMSAPDDRNARIVFDLGTFIGNIYFDDLSIRTLGESKVARGNLNHNQFSTSMSIISRGNGLFALTTATNVSGVFELLDISGKCIARLSPAKYIQELTI